MADQVQVTVTGADRVASTMRSAGRQIGNLSDVNHKVAQLIAEASRAPAPKLTGALASATRGIGARDTVGVQNPLPYFGPIHYGWPAHNIAPQPFVDEGMDISERQWMELYEKAADDAANDVKGA